MVTLASLWLPILVSAVAVFFTSFVMWMVLPHHKSDWKGLPDEDALMETLRGQGTQAGQYVFPYCEDRATMSSPEFIEKYKTGPSGMMIVRPAGGMNMGKSMVASTLFNLILSIFVAYVASFVFDAGTEGLQVFRLTSIVAFLGYAGALAWAPIWWGRTWSSTFKEMLDGLAYGLVTGLVFMLLWP